VICNEQHALTYFQQNKAQILSALKIYL